MSQPTTVWQRLKSGSKSGFDKGWRTLDKLGAPVNRLSNKLGSEAFWPTTLDKESDKAARILKSFCKDGFYVEEDTQAEDGPTRKQRVVKKIPEEVIRNAKGLAIFTTMRTGLWVSGAGGSGVLVARQSDGTWSPPSGIMLHTAGLGFLVGIDIYDCVLVLNTEQAVEAFTKIRCTLGGEVSVVAGPVGVGGILESEIHTRQSPIFTYMKSRGFYAGVQIDGTIVIERMDENERFYGEEVPVKDILAGRVRHPPLEVNGLMETIKAAQGDTHYDATMIPDEPPPGDYELHDGNMFGVPDREDPDPYGVLALEKEGMSLREAGTQQRASWEQFSFNPAPTSPVHSIYARNSHDGGARANSSRSSWRNTLNGEPRVSSSLRNSITSARSIKSPMADSSTQTDLTDDLPSPRGRIGSKRSSQQSAASSGSSLPRAIPEDEVLDSRAERVGASEPSKVTNEVSRPNEGSRDLTGQIGFPKDDPVSSTMQPTQSSDKSTPERKQLSSVSTNNGYSTPPNTPPAEAGISKHDDQPLDHDVDGDVTLSDDEYDDDDLEIIEEPVVHSVQALSLHTSAPQAFPGAARVVTVPKRLPPKLPERNPNRGKVNRRVITDSSPPVDTASFEAAVANASSALVLQDVDTFKTTNSDSEFSPVGASKLSDEDLDAVNRVTPIIPDVSSQQGQNLEEKMDDFNLNGDNSAPVLRVGDEQQSPEIIPKVPGGFD